VDKEVDKGSMHDLSRRHRAAWSVVANPVCSWRKCEQFKEPLPYKQLQPKLQRNQQSEALNRRHGEVGQCAGLKIRSLPLVKESLPRTVANMSDQKRTKETVIRSTRRQQLLLLLCAWKKSRAPL